MPTGIGNLREIVVADLPQILEWRNSERISKYMFTDQFISMEQHRAWFESLSHETKLKYLIFEYNGEPAGVVNFTYIDYRNHKCHWGFYLGKENLPPGTGTLMGQLAISYAYEVLNIRKLCGEVFAFNQSSVSFHQKMGFTEEGTLIKHVLKKGNYVDVICFALFNERFMNGDE
jgi:UDP-4-amino-4,6-dideoxy-N-acetyl-beta-L-altrosamine N-acetyltransferase